MTTAPAGERARAPRSTRAPVPVDVMVRRARLLETLRGSRDTPVVALVAPGGYGKTTVVAQWAAEDPRRFVWLAVDPTVCDAASLAEDLVGALVPAEAGPTLPRVSEEAGWHSVVLPVVQSVVAGQRKSFVVVIDDLGRIGGPAVDALLGAVVAALPRGSQLVVASRTAPPKPLRRLRPQARILEIGPELLAMDPTEAERLMDGLGVGLSDDDFLALLEQTEGWPVGLYLLGRSYVPGGRGLARPRPRDPAAWMSDYLRDELVDDLPAEDATFLRRCSVLEVLTADACDAVSEMTDSLTRLRRLAAGNRLLIRLDEGGERFRMHHLLQEHLLSELRGGDPAGYHAAHAAAGRVLDLSGDVDAAVAHAREAGDDPALSDLVWSRAGLLLGRGQTPVIRRWLEPLSDDRLAAQCGLALTSAIVASHAGDQARMDRFVRHAAAGCSTPEAPASRRLDLLVVQAIAAHDGVRAMIEWVDEAICGKSADDVWLTVAYYLRGVGRSLFGQADAALLDFDAGLRIAEAFDVGVMSAFCLTGRANLALAGGDVPAAAAAMTLARRLMVDNGMENLATSGPIFTTSARVYLAEARRQEAAAEAARGLRLTTLMGSVAPWHAVEGRLALARTWLGLGDAERARVLVAEARALHGPASRAPVIDAALVEAEALVSGWEPGPEGPSTLTTAELRVLQYLPSHLSFPEIGQQLYLSRHTVKSQALSAYRKLGVRSRSEAVERARTLGLLPAG